MKGLTHWILYRTYHGECSKKLFDLLPADEFSNQSVHHKFKYHPNHLDTWHCTTVQFRKNFLTRVTQLWNDLSAAVLADRYDIKTLLQECTNEQKARLSPQPQKQKVSKIWQKVAFWVS